MYNKKEFLDRKKSALVKLNKDITEKKVDTGIQPILNILNKSDSYYTTSSCFGRIVLLEIPAIGDKKNAKFLGRWHKMIDSNDILLAGKNAKKGQIWILAQSPIIHITAISIEAADYIVKIANASGFKNSSFKSIGNSYVIEVSSTERLDSPIGLDGILFCNEKYLDFLIKTANNVIEKSIIKLHRLENNLNNKF